MHILFILAPMGLWSPLEKMWEGIQFFFFYFSAGIGAALDHTGVNYYYFNPKGLDALVSTGIPRSR